MDSKTAVIIYLSAFLIVSIGVIIKQIRGEVSKSVRIEICGVCVEFDFSDNDEFIKGIEKIPQEYLDFLSNEGYVVCISGSMYGKMFGKYKRCDFDVEYDYDMKQCYHVCKSQKIILLRKQDGVEKACSNIINWC